MSSYDEKNVLDIIEKVSKSVVNISTIKLKFLASDFCKKIRKR